MKRALRISAILLVCLLPITAYAQAKKPSPPPPSLRCDPPFTDRLRCPHPVEPWFGPAYPGRAAYGVVPNRPPTAQDLQLYGTVIRYIEVPAQQVVVPLYIPGPGSFPGEFEQQVVEIPGYFVTETTTGYVYPQRWSLEQVGPGVYYWRVLPPLFTAK